MLRSGCSVAVAWNESQFFNKKKAVLAEHESFAYVSQISGFDLCNPLHILQNITFAIGSFSIFILSSKKQFCHDVSVQKFMINNKRAQIILDFLKTEVISIFMDSFMNYDSFMNHRFNSITSYYWTKISAYHVHFCNFEIFC